MQLPKFKARTRIIILATAAFLFFVASPAPDTRSAGIQGPITHAETSYSTGASAGTSIVAPIVSHTQGNLIAVFISALNPGTMSISDTQGNTYTAATTATNHGATGQWFYTFASATGDNIVTGSFTNNATYRFIRVLEYSGISTTNPVDVQGAGINNSATSPAFTTTSANELILVGWHTNTSAYCYAGEGYTLVPNDYCKESIARPVEQRIVSSIQTNATASIVQAGNIQGGWVVSFRGATGETIAETPTFSMAEGAYNTAQSVTISTETSGATICYTTDGTAPASSPAGTCAAGSTAYSGAINVASSTTIKAIATKSGMEDSYIASAEYVISSITGIMDLESSNAASDTAISVSTIDPAVHTAGNLLAVFAAATNPLSISISDTQGNSYTAAADAYALSTGGMTGRWFYAYAKATGSNTITATFGQSATNRVIHVFEYAGIAPSSPLDIHAEYTKTATPLFTTSAPDEVILSAWYVSGGVSGSACHAGHGYAFTAGSYNCATANAWPVEERIVTSIQTNASASLGHTGTGTTNGSWTVSFKGAVAPTFSPEGGIYGSSQSVALSTTMTGATICYTTDGSIPTTNGAGACVNGSAYSSPLTVDETTTIRAVATVSGGSDSVVSSAAYTIDSSKLITFTTTATSFTPIIEVDGNPLIQWDFGADATSARYSHLSAPTATYADSSSHTVTLVVTPWSAVNTINIGYSTDDGGTVNIQTLAQQNVTAITGLANVAPYLRAWASYQNPIASLDFSNFSKIEVIESGYNNSLTSINLTGTSSLKRLSVEECGSLTSLDLSQSPLLEDLRNRDNSPVVSQTITWGTTGKYLWHLCVGARNMLNNFPIAQFPNLRIYYANSADQTGILDVNSPYMEGDLQASANSYTEAYLDGAYAAGVKATVHLDGNQLTVLDVSDDPGLKYLYAQNNKLSQWAVDNVLRQLDEAGLTGGTVNLSGNSGAPSLAGEAYKASLIAKGWTVTTDSIAVASPSFTPAAGEYYLTQTVALSSATDGAIIYYTTDGSTPTTSSTIYSAPFSVSSDTVVKAIAVKDGYANSQVARANYDIQGPVTHVEQTPQSASAASVSAPAAYHTAGNLIAVFVAAINTGVITVSDTQGNEYTAAGAANDSGIIGQWFYAYAASSSSNIVTATFGSGAATYRSIRVLEYTDVIPSSPVDVYASGLGATTPLFTTNSKDELILAAFHIENDTVSCTAGEGYTLNSACTTGITRIVEQRIVSSIQTNTFAEIGHTGGAPSNNWVVSFKLDAGTRADSPAFSVASGSYNTIQYVSLSSGTAGATICYTTDGSTPETNGAGNCAGARTRTYYSGDPVRISTLSGFPRRRL